MKTTELPELVEDLDFSIRVSNILEAEAIKETRKLMELNANELHGLQGMGWTSVREIHQRLQGYGYGVHGYQGYFLPEGVVPKFRDQESPLRKLARAKRDRAQGIADSLEANGIPQRVGYVAARELRVENIRDFQNLTAEQILGLTNVGKTTLWEIRKALGRLEIALKNEVPVESRYPQEEAEIEGALRSMDRAVALLQGAVGRLRRAWKKTQGSPAQLGPKHREDT